MGVRGLVSGGPASPEIKEFIDGFFAARVAQLEPVVARAVKAKQLPRGTSAELLYKHTAGPLYYRTLIMADVLTEADADIGDGRPRGRPGGRIRTHPETPLS